MGTPSEAIRAAGYAVGEFADADLSAICSQLIIANSILVEIKILLCIVFALILFIFVHKTITNIFQYV